MHTGGFTMTLHESLEIGVKGAALWNAGKEDEAMTLFKTNPMPPWMAKIWKENGNLNKPSEVV
jgi:hypothetical protein